MENIANFENELARNTDQAADSAESSAQKPKCKAEKMAMTTKDMDVMCTTIEESTTVVSDRADRTPGRQIQLIVSIGSFE